MATNCQTEKSHSRKQPGLSVATFANVGTSSKEEISLIPWVSYTRTRSLCSRWRGFSELINVNTGPWSPKRKVGEREEAGCWSLWNAHQLLDHFSSRMDIRDEVVSPREIFSSDIFREPASWLSLPGNVSHRRTWSGRMQEIWTTFSAQCRYSTVWLRLFFVY